MRRGNPCQMLQEVARQKGNLLAENHQSAETADHLENGCSSVSGQRESGGCNTEENSFSRSI